MKYSSIPLAHTLVTLCRSFGIKQVVISPGSRNAPLILGFASDPYFECFSIVDERSAGFFALGLSQQSQKPTVLVCTSGSALLNYYPAVAEAYYSRIPLIVISADRPPYKIDIGDGQTIRQTGVLEKHIGYEANLLQDVTHATEAIRWDPGAQPGTREALEKLQIKRQGHNERRISRALQIALGEGLPVHLNAPFEEPLYGTLEEPEFTPMMVSSDPPSPKAQDWESLITPWSKARKKMVLIGSMHPGSLGQEALERLAGDDSVMVLTETTSNAHHSGFFPSIDSIMAPLEISESGTEHFHDLRPDVLLTFGGMVVSKKVKQFLRKYRPATHWHVDPHRAPDTYYCLERHIRMSPGEFLDEFLPRVPKGDSAFKAPWKRYRLRYEEKRAEYLRRIPFTDMKAFSGIIDAIPPGTQVQLANSSPVRYAQLFDMQGDSPVFCNRGTSGIEGSTSTAVGASVNAGQPVLLISGDLSFLYDSNGLWNRYLRPDFRIIVINNQGGGIFRILPGKLEDKTFETFFETVQEGSVRSLCQQFGILYSEASDESDLSRELDSFFAPCGSPRLLEVKTPRKLNDGVLLGYFDFLSSAIPQTTHKTDSNE
jgi:2-succinyl-5-enolpyruvyl-6-hydroxy-3-cyclohexene-1-carboxylate synthase